jgi:transcriptional regulator with XRE-family HTH domain
MTDLPFAKAVRELLEELDISQRELIRRTRKRGWGSPGTISFLMRDEQPPTVKAMEAIARALQVRPEHFAEYRLAKARSCLDPAVVGLDAALHGIGAAKAALSGK